MAEWENKVEKTDLLEVRRILSEHKRATGTTVHLASVLNSRGIPIVKPELVQDISDILRQEHTLWQGERVTAKHLIRKPGSAGTSYFYGLQHGAAAARRGDRGIDEFNQHDEMRLTRGKYDTLYEKAVPSLWMHRRESDYGNLTIGRRDAANAEEKKPAETRPNLLGKFEIKVRPLKDVILPEAIKSEIANIREKQEAELKKHQIQTNRDYALSSIADYLVNPAKELNGLAHTYEWIRVNAVKNMTLMANENNYLDKLHEALTDTYHERIKNLFLELSRHNAKTYPPSTPLLRKFNWERHYTNFLKRQRDEFKELGFDFAAFDELYHSDGAQAYTLLVGFYKGILKNELKAKGLPKANRKKALALAGKYYDELTGRTKIKSYDVKREVDKIKTILAKVHKLTQAQAPKEETWTVDFTPSPLDRVAGFISQDCVERRADFFDAPGMHNGKVRNAKGEWVGNVYVVEAKARPTGMYVPVDGPYLNALHIDGIQVPVKIDAAQFSANLVAKLAEVAKSKKLNVREITGNRTLAYVSNHAHIQNGYAANFNNNRKREVHFSPAILDNSVYSATQEDRHNHLLLRQV